jgi:hypothetical protein
MFYREMLVWVVGGVGLVGAPAVGPDFGRTQQLPACPQDDTDGLVVEN